MTRFLLPSALALLGCTFDLPSPRGHQGAGGAAGEGGAMGGAGGTDTSAIVCILDAGDAARQSVSALATEGNGEIAVAGQFNGSMQLGGATIVNPNSSDLAGYVTRIDGSCQPLWAQPLTGTGSVGVTALAIDSHQVWAVGSFGGQLEVGGAVGPIDSTSEGNKDAFVVQLDDQGAPAIALQLGGAGGQEPHALVHRSDGTLFIAGGFSNELVVSDVPILTSVGGVDAFIVELALTGDSFVLLDHFSFPLVPSVDEKNQSIQQMVLDTDGNIIIAGEYDGTSDFGPLCKLATLQGNQDMFVAKLDDQGNCLWARGFGGADADFAEGLAVDDDQDVLFAGSYKGTLDLGTGALTAAGEFHDVIVAKLRGTDGVTLWSHGYGDDNEQHAKAVVSTADNDPIVAIDMAGKCDFDPRTDVGLVESINNSADAVLVRLTADGSFDEWARRFGDAADQRPQALGSDELGLVVAGDFGGTLGEGDDMVTGDSLDDIFVMRLSDPRR